MILRYCKNIANLLFWELWKYLTISIKIIVSVCVKPSCLSACTKPTSSLTFFFKYCKEVPNLLFWVIWVCQISIIIFVLILDYFQVKLMTKLFTESKNPPYFGSILGLFCPNLIKTEFTWKKVCQTLDIPII